MVFVRPDAGPKFSIPMNSGDARVDIDLHAGAHDQTKSGRAVDGPAHQQASWFGINAGEVADGGGLYVGVVFNRPFEQVLTYHAPLWLSPVIQPGQRVRVPLGRGDHEAVGYCVWIDPHAPGDVEPARIKDVLEVLDRLPLIDRKMLELTRWMADYYACSWGQALDAVVPAGVKKHAGTRVGTFLVVPEETREALRGEANKLHLTAKQTAVLDVLCRETEPLTTADVCRLAKLHQRADSSIAKAGIDPHRPTAAARRDWATRARPPAPALGVSQPSKPIWTARAGRNAGTARAGPGSRWFRAVLDPRRDRQRQDRGLSGGDRAGGGARPRGDRAGARDQPDAADDPPVPPAVCPGRGPAQPPERRRAAPALAEHRLGRGPGRRRRPVGDLRADAAARPDRDRRGAREQLQAGDHAARTTPATWPSSGPSWRACRSCSARPRPRWRAGATPSAAATPGWRCPPGWATGRCPRVEIIDLRNEKAVDGRPERNASPGDDPGPRATEAR